MKKQQNIFLTNFFYYVPQVEVTTSIWSPNTFNSSYCFWNYCLWTVNTFILWKCNEQI
jgi:hypothetical protein